MATQAEAGLVGTLRIGVVTSALSEPLLGTLAAFRDARPRVYLHLTEVDTGEGQEAVARHEIDLAVIRPSAPVRGLRVRPWRHDQFVIALPDGHPLTGDTTDPSTSPASRTSPGCGCAARRPPTTTTSSWRPAAEPVSPRRRGTSPTPS